MAVSKWNQFLKQNKNKGMSIAQLKKAYSQQHGCASKKATECKKSDTCDWQKRANGKMSCGKKRKTSKKKRKTTRKKKTSKKKRKSTRKKKKTSKKKK